MLTMVTNLDTDLGGAINLAIFGLFALGGLYLFMNGIFTIAAAAGPGSSSSVMGGWIKVGLASLLFLLSSLLGTTAATLFGSGVNLGSLGNEASGTPSSTCTATASSSLSTCALNNMAGLVGPLIHLVFVFAFVAGVYLIGSTLWESAHDLGGPRNSGRFPWGKIIGGTLLVASPLTMQAVESTLGINGGVISASGYSSSSALLSYVPPIASSMSSQLGGNVDQLLSSVLKLLAFFGCVSFIKGIFVLIKLTDLQGSQDASVGKALTFMLGGAAVANMGWAVPAVGNWMFGSGNGMF